MADTFYPEHVRHARHRREAGVRSAGGVSSSPHGGAALCVGGGQDIALALEKIESGHHRLIFSTRNSRSVRTAGDTCRRFASTMYKGLLLPFQSAHTVRSAPRVRSARTSMRER
jgi:hypothetical protein